MCHDTAFRHTSEDFLRSIPLSRIFRAELAYELPRTGYSLPISTFKTELEPVGRVRGVCIERAPERNGAHEPGPESDSSPFGVGRMRGSRT